MNNYTAIQHSNGTVINYSEISLAVINAIVDHVGEETFRKTSRQQRCEILNHVIETLSNLKDTLSD